MKKFLLNNAKKLFIIVLCFTMCFSCVFISTGCVFGDPGDITGGTGSGGTGGSGTENPPTGGGTGGETTTPPTGGGTGGEVITPPTGGGSGTQNPPTTERHYDLDISTSTDEDDIVYLTINANSGLYEGSEVYIVKADKNATYTLSNPTHNNKDLAFAGWVKHDGKGSLSGSTFTFGSSDAIVKATWEGGVMDIDINDYVAGGRFTYKPEPAQLLSLYKNNNTAAKNYVDAVKEQLNKLGKDIWYRLFNYYLDGTGGVVVNSSETSNNMFYSIDTIPQNVYTAFFNKLSGSMNDWHSIKQIYKLSNIETSKILDDYKYHIQFLYAGVISDQFTFNGTKYLVKTDSTLPFEKDLNYILYAEQTISNRHIRTIENSTVFQRYEDVINDYVVYFDHVGLLDYESEILIQLIIDEIIGTGNVNSDLETVNDLDSTSTLNFNNNDNIDGFGAEMYFNNISSLESTDLDFTFTDTNGNNVYEDGETVTYEQKYASFMELYNNSGVVKFVDTDYDKKFDCWTRETFIAKGYCTAQQYDADEYYYHLYNNNGNLAVEFKAGSTNVQISDIGTIKNNCFVPSQGYEFDIRKDGFKNYQTFVNDTVHYLSNATYSKVNDEAETIKTEYKIYPHTPSLYVQDLALSEMTVDLSNGLDGGLFNSNIISNNQGSGVSMQSVILNVKKEMLLQNMSMVFEFRDENIIKFNLNMKVRFYDGKTLHEFDIGNFVINEGECDLMFGDSVEIDFKDIAARVGMQTEGFLIKPYESLLNNGTQISTNNVGYKAEVISELDNYQNCFEIETNASGQGAVSKYIDTSSSFFEIIFDAEKINGVTPSYKVSFMSIDIANPTN